MGKAFASASGASSMALLALLAAGSAIAAGRDHAYYPVSGAPTPARASAPLLFETVCALTVPGLPATAEFLGTQDGDSCVFDTSEGRFRVDVAQCVWDRSSALPGDVSADPAFATKPGAGRLAPDAEGFPAVPPAVSDPGPLPSPGKPWWYRRLESAHMGGTIAFGPDARVAIVGGDGTIYGRTGRRGHLLWRRIAANRTSRRGLSFGEYLLIAPDASRTLEAYRWSDGTLAGIMRLDSEDAVFASVPISAGPLVFALTVQSPRYETRFIALRPKPAELQAPPLAR